MHIPAVSHKNWERARVMADIELGEVMDSDELSFQDKLRVIFDVAHGEAIAEMEEEGGGWNHPRHPEGGRFTYDSSTRQREHRPQLDDEVYEMVQARAREYYPDIPLDSQPFDTELRLILDAVEDWYSYLGIELVDKGESDRVEIPGGDVL